MTEYIYSADGDEGHWLTGEEIVRCGDCVYYNTGIGSNGRRYEEPYCNAIGELAFGALLYVDEDDFCSWGEKGKDGE